MCPPFLSAQLATFAHEDGTTHWYRAVLVPDGVDYAAARLLAAEAGGYLATITSAGEALAVFGLVDQAKFWTWKGGELLGPWLGGLRDDSSEPPTWRWGELEPFVFSAWTPGQPDKEGDADRICLGGAATRVATWADEHHDRMLAGLVVEFSGPTVRRTVGLLQQEPGSFDGYTLFNPLQSTETYLIDARGRRVNWWKSEYVPGTAVYLEPDGHLLRAGRLVNPAFQGFGGDGGIVEEYDWEGNKVWEYVYSSPTLLQHHDVERLPSGNVLLIAWEKIAGSAAIDAGRAPGLLPAGEVWSEKIVEVKPTGPASGLIVWEWRVFDHLVQDVDASKANYGLVGDHPERVDVNYTTNNGAADWLHFNAVAYNPALDQVVISARNVNEIWIIDHSTTTAEAASSAGGRSGRGGDLLFRYGNPQAHRAGSEADRSLYWQHDAHWIAPGLPGAGNMLVFNNGGQDRPGGPHSTVDELVLPPADGNGNYQRSGNQWGPTLRVWSYSTNPPSAFYSQFVSGAQRLPNGNTLVCAGWTGNMFEVTSDGRSLRSYTNPINGAGTLRQGSVPSGNMVFRGPAYARDYAAFHNRALVARQPLEAHASVLLADGSTVRRETPLGSDVRLDLRARYHPDKAYLVLTSLTPGVAFIDSRAVRLGFDELTVMSVSGLAPNVFQGYFGRLDGDGVGSARLAIPDLPPLVGLAFYSAFVVVDFDSPSSIGLLSNTVEVRVVP